MKNRLNISFCIPTCDRVNFLNIAINSILNLKNIDKLNNYEILVSDDGTSNIAERQIKNISNGNNHLRYYKNPQKNQFNNLNNLIKKAKFPWIVFLHDDDILDEEYLVNVFDSKILIDNNIDIISTGRYLIDKDGKEIRNYCAEDNVHNKYITFSGKSYVDAILSNGDSTNGNMVAPMVTGLAIKKNLIHKAGFFDDSFKVNADLLFLWRIYYLSNKACYINKPLVKYRIMDNSERSKPSEEGIIFKEMKGILSAILKFIKPYLDIHEYSKRKIKYVNNFYKTALKINGPVLWIALRYKGSYSERLSIQRTIISESICNMPILLLYFKTWLTFFISIFPQKLLRKLYMTYLKYF